MQNKSIYYEKLVQIDSPIYKKKKYIFNATQTASYKPKFRTKQTKNPLQW